VRTWQDAGLVRAWPAGGLAALDPVAGDADASRALLAAVSLAMLIVALIIDYRGSLLTHWPGLRRRLRAVGHGIAGQARRLGWLRD
jgi:hypothetical protein